ncbi:hypothetical protein AWH60_11050 [Pseudoalteromonas haloplanktis]|nr:hypothetical protein AWH60_11050 [Pseudoalteromonas haloplanktis]
MLRCLLGVLFSALSLTASAACVSTGCSGVYVDTLYVNASGIIYIGTSGDEKAMSCSAVSDVYATLNITKPGADAIYSTLLSAQMSGKLVYVRTVDNSSQCEVLYVTLERQ